MHSSKSSTASSGREAEQIGARALTTPVKQWRDGLQITTKYEHIVLSDRRNKKPTHDYSGSLSLTNSKYSWTNVMARISIKLKVELDLYDLVRGHPAFSDFYVENVIKTGPDHVTAISILNGKKVIVKQSLQPKAHHQVIEAKQELDTVAAVMNAAPYRINECIAAFPELGLIALSYVPGVRLDHAIRQAGLYERLALLTLSGGWLLAYIGNRSEISLQFSPQWWIKKRLLSFGSGRPKELQYLFDSVIDHLRACAPALRGQAITKAAVHGDYSSINAHYHDGSIYGVDIQGRAQLPIVQDAAKFLVWTQIQTPLESPLAPENMKYIYGIAEPDYSAFVESGVVPTEEMTTFLPFFVGLQLLQYIGVFQNNQLALSHTKKMVSRFLQSS